MVARTRSPIPSPYMRILSTTAEIQSAVVRLMQPGVRRVAITAFVGAGASAYIPKPEGVTVVCWPKAGGTNPAAVRDLLARGANVLFADRLHMKLYWAEGRGAIIGSANLSTNALGSGGLKELAALLPARSVDIDQVLGSVSSRKVSNKELDRLELEHRKLGRKITGSGISISFRDWFEMQARSRWKLGWWDSAVNYSPQARTTAKADFGRSPVNSIWGRAREHVVGDWVLSFCVTKKRVYPAKWLFVNFVVRARRKNETYPFEAVQVWTGRQCTPPPFAINKAFNRALSKACHEFGIKQLKDLETVKPPEKLLRGIYGAMPA